MLENILNELFGAFLRRALYVGPVLHIMVDARWKISPVNIATRTVLDFRLVLGYDQLQWGQVIYLAHSMESAFCRRIAAIPAVL